MRNVCINTARWAGVNSLALEKDMAECGRRYGLYQPEDFEWTSSGEDTEEEQRFGDGEDQNQETSGKLATKINQKLDAIEEKLGVFESRLKDLNKKFKNPISEIKEIKHFVEMIYQRE
jgi:hypothetical protein